MKKSIIALLLCLIVCFSVASCGEETTVRMPDPEILLAQMQPSAEENLDTEIKTLDLDNNDEFKKHFFVDVEDSVKKAAICEPLINVIPFFLGILKVETAKEAEKLADKIEDNINYQKLICVSFEKVYVLTYGDSIVLICDADADRAARMREKWEALAES